MKLKKLIACVLSLATACVFASAAFAEGINLPDMSRVEAGAATLHVGDPYYIVCHPKDDGPNENVDFNVTNNVLRHTTTERYRADGEAYDTIRYSFTAVQEGTGIMYVMGYNGASGKVETSHYDITVLPAAENPEDPSAPSEEPSTDTPEDVTEDTPEDVTEDTPEDVTEDTPEDVTEDTPEDVTEDTPEDVTEDTPEDVTGSVETPSQTPAAAVSAPAAEEHSEIGEAIANGTWGAEYTVCESCGQHNWTACAEGYRCDNCGHVTSSVKTGSNVAGYTTPTAAASASTPVYATAAQAQADADQREAAYAASVAAYQKAAAEREAAYLRSLGL